MGKALNCKSEDLAGNANFYCFFFFFCFFFGGGGKRVRCWVLNCKSKVLAENDNFSLLGGGRVV